MSDDGMFWFHFGDNIKHSSITTLYLSPSLKFPCFESVFTKEFQQSISIGQILASDIPS